MSSRRAGSKELIALLKENGATDLDWNDPKTKAAATLIDGEILQELLDKLSVEDGSKSNQMIIPYEALRAYTAGTTLKFAQANGKDLFGRPFVLSTKHTISVVKIDPETIKA